MRTLTLTLEQAATLVQLHPRTLQRAIRRGHLRAFKTGPGRTAGVRVLPSDLRGWLSTFPAAATAPPVERAS